MTYWLYTYVPWFWPPVAAALLLGAGAAAAAPSPAPRAAAPPDAANEVEAGAV